MSGTAKSELGRNAAIYGGALLLPRLAAFIALIVFSRLLAPAEYGYFALFVISAELMDTVLLNWIRIALLRLYPEHETAGRLSVLRRTCLSMTGLALLVSVPVAVLLTLLAAPDRWVGFLILLVAMMFASSVVRLRLAELQAQQNAKRYFLIEVGRATLSLGVSLALVELIEPNFMALSAGFVGANVAVALACLPTFLPDLPRLVLDRTIVRSVLSYAGPIVPLTALQALIPLTERYVIQFVAGPAAVGVYSATQNLVQQPISMLASAVALSAFPIIMRSAETDGHKGAQFRMREAGTYLLALGLPAVAGIIALSSEIVSVVLGEEFRQGAVAIVPWAAVTAILINLKYHYFDAAFHVTRRLVVQLITLLPATLLTAPLIYVFLKVWGLPGAAAGACLAFTVSLAASWLVGRRILVIPHAFGEMARIAVAVGFMLAVLWAVPSTEGVLGLAIQIAAGGAAYICAALALNILEMRTVLAGYLTRAMQKPVAAS
jgi:O-antigen/teichoic acid export membrane protein